ncbi:MAG: hypothetical protein WC799_08455 [Desulfobacteraceae bacterium]|jgi:hypothetical protein
MEFKNRIKIELVFGTSFYCGRASVAAFRGESPERGAVERYARWDASFLSLKNYAIVLMKNQNAPILNSMFDVGRSMFNVHYSPHTLSVPTLASPSANADPI